MTGVQTCALPICSLEVDYIAAILLPCEDIGQGGFVPLAAVILVERLIFTGSPPPVFHIESEMCIRDRAVSVPLVIILWVGLRQSLAQAERSRLSRKAPHLSLIHIRCV